MGCKLTKTKDGESSADRKSREGDAPEGGEHGRDGDGGGAVDAHVGSYSESEPYSPEMEERRPRSRSRDSPSNSSFQSGGNNSLSGKEDLATDKAGGGRPTHLIVDEDLLASAEELFGGMSPQSQRTRLASIAANCVDLSPHSSDDELVLVCLDCGCEITEDTGGTLCPVSAKLHA